MESSQSEDFFGVLVEKIGLTIWCPDFCDGHRTELCSIAETLSYVKGKNNIVVVTKKIVFLAICRDL